MEGFRNNGDVAFTYHNFGLFLGVSTVRFAVVFAERPMTVFVSTDFSFGIFDLTPALIVGDMPVRRFMLCKALHVDVGLYFIHGKEMTAGIEMRATIAKAGSVIDFYGWHGNISHRQPQAMICVRTDAARIRRLP